MWRGVLRGVLRRCSVNGMNPTTIKLPAKHAMDWWGRYDEEGAEVVAHSARTVTLRLDRAALMDLISDADYYAAEMSPDNTGDIDYRPAARRCLASLAKQVDLAGIRAELREEQRQAARAYLAQRRHDCVEEGGNV